MAASAVCDSNTWFGAVAQVVPWVLVIIGWVIVNRQNNVRETRKEVRQALDKLREKLEALERKAISFHKMPYDEAIARELNIEISRIGRLAKRTSLLASKLQNRRLIELRRAITLKNFDQSSHVELKDDNPLLAGISAAVDELIDDLEDGFAKTYLK